MASNTESAASRKRKKSNPRGTAVLLLLALLAAQVLLWSDIRIETPVWNRSRPRLYRSASLTTASIAEAC